MTSSRSIGFAVVIPAYKPSEGLIALVETLSRKNFPAIIVVDDGGGPAFRDTFDRVAQFPGVHLLRHAVNLGKGAALKTAFNYALCTFPDLAGVITADADGQHHPDDIERVSFLLMAKPNSLVLGCRQFAADVPLRSRFGNIVTRSVMHGLLGRKISDTQTGLRGIPAALLPKLMRVESTGYEYEMEMLLQAHRLEIPIIEEPIRTIYENNNASSHFNPIIDSMKIYFVLLRFGSVSFGTALLDNLIFYLVWRRSGNVLAAQIIARIIAVAANYTMVRSSVFHSRQAHKTVLPKYLALVLASGSISYQAIILLRSALGVETMVAKISVEALLFVVNFVVQRVFIFRPQEFRERTEVLEQLEPEPRKPKINPWVPAALLAGLVAILVGFEIYGFAANHLMRRGVWIPEGWHRFLRFGGIYIGMAVPLLVLLPWVFPVLACGLMVVLSAVAVGPMAVIGPLYFLLSACSLGCLLMGKSSRESVAGQLGATMAGASIYILLMTWIARLPVHYPVTWAILLAIPIALDFGSLRERLHFWIAQTAQAQLSSVWSRVGFAGVLFFVLAHWLVVLKPEVGADALSMHLAIPVNIAVNHALTITPAKTVWAVMPMGADWCYSIVYLFGGEFASRLLNFAMFLVLLGLLYLGARRWLSQAPALLLTAAFASTPVVQMVTGSLFVENLMAALVLGMLTLIWRFSETADRRALYAAALLGAAALNTKLGSTAFLVPSLVFFAVEIARNWKALGRKPLVHCAALVVILLAAGLSPYIIAYAKTGNPIYPFANEKIHSPLLDPKVTFNDDRFKVPLNPAAVYTLTFHTSKAWEGQDGSFGLQYFVLAPLALLGLLVPGRGRRYALAVTTVGFLASYLILRSQPNVRYLYAAMPLVIIGVSPVLAWTWKQHRWLYMVLTAYLGVVTVVNAWFLPSSSYYHKDFSLPNPFSQKDRDRYLLDTSPIRKVIDYYNHAHPKEPVMLTSTGEAAGLTGEFYENHWHQYPVFEKVHSALDTADLLTTLHAWKVNYFIVPKPLYGAEPLHPETLKKLIEVCTAPEFQAGDVYLARLEPGCESREGVKLPTEPSITLPKGFYDDPEPGLLYRGDWAHDQSFAEPALHTVSYTDVKGAEVSISFEGRSLIWMFTKAYNRGKAEVLVDGVSLGVVDLYSPQIVWQSSKEFCCFGPGKHLAKIRVTGESNPASTGTFVDLDAFEVK